MLQKSNCVCDARLMPVPLIVHRYVPYRNFWQAITSLVMLMFGNFPEAVVRRAGDPDESFEGADELMSSDWTYFSQLVLVFFFVFLTSMFVLNVLIAILSLEYGRLDGSERWRFERAMLINELQSYKFLRLCFQVLDSVSNPWFEAMTTSSRGVLVREDTLVQMSYSDIPRHLRWMHVMPPDDNKFWKTQMEPEPDAKAAYSSLVALERDVRAIL